MNGRSPSVEAPSPDRKMEPPSCFMTQTPLGSALKTGRPGCLYLSSLE